MLRLEDSPDGRAKYTGPKMEKLCNFTKFLNDIENFVKLQHELIFHEIFYKNKQFFKKKSKIVHFNLLVKLRFIFTNFSLLCERLSPKLFMCLDDNPLYLNEIFFIGVP